jgi:uncharacterized protein (TIGR03437 family)
MVFPSTIAFMRSICICGSLLWFVAAAQAQLPVVSDGGVANAATFERSAAVAPGSMVAIFGTGLAGGLTRLDSAPLSATIADVSVTFNGMTAPLQFVSENMISAQIPWQVLSDPTVAGTANVVVTRLGVQSQTVTVPIVPFAPAIHRFHTWTTQAMVFNADGSLTAAAGAIDGVQSHPAVAGDTLLVYANGLGAVTPAISDGVSSPDTTRVTMATPTVLIQGIAAKVQFSGLSPKFPGMNLLSVIVPPGITAGDQVPIQIQMGSITTSAQLTIAVRAQ